MPEFNPPLGINVDVKAGPGPIPEKKLFKIDGAIAYTSGGLEYTALKKQFEAFTWGATEEERTG